MKILLGFLDPTEGSVLIDGLPLRQINIRHYRRQLGVVLQSTKLPPGSIYDIICAGRSYTDDQVWDALEKCAIADQVRQFPMGLETIITESPAISGGQRQRLASQEHSSRILRFYYLMKPQVPSTLLLRRSSAML